MLKISIYLASVLFPLIWGLGIFNESDEVGETNSFIILKSSYSSSLIRQELRVIDQTLLTVKPNVSFPNDQLRALLLLASDKQALASRDNNRIMLDYERLAIADHQGWKEWVQSLALEHSFESRSSASEFYWSEKLSEALNDRLTAKDLYLTSLYVDEQRKQ